MICDFNSELRGSYKEGIMRMQSGKSYGSLTSIQEEETLNHQIIFKKFSPVDTIG